MGLKFKYILISGALLAVFLALPLFHDHPNSIYDPNCFAGKIELGLLAYSLTFLSLILMTLAGHPFVNAHNNTFLAIADYYHFFINRAPPSPF
jgi:hypothetical protein